MAVDDIRFFFDSRAEGWDSLASHPSGRVDRVLDIAGDITGRSVLDVGSGTGILVAPLLDRVGASGRVIALDLAPRMIELSRRKHEAPNLSHAVGDFLAWSAALEIDLIVAYSCYPHFLDPPAFWEAARRNLAPGGRVLIAHIEGRQAINAMHGHLENEISLPLAPMHELARFAEEHGFSPLYSEDSDEYYILLASLGTSSAMPGSLARELRLG